MIGIFAGGVPCGARANEMKTYWEQDNNKIYLGNALEVLKSMASESVHCCVTSPPYW